MLASSLASRRAGATGVEPRSCRPEPGYGEEEESAEIGWHPPRAGFSLPLLGFAISLLLVVPLRWIDPPTSAFMLRDRLAGVAVNQEWVDWDRIGSALPIAVVASEDQKFPSHHGFDLESMQDALEGGAGRGASTITQQVAKNLYLWPRRSWVRRVSRPG